MATPGGPSTKLAELIARLLERTASGAIYWHEGEQEGSYVYPARSGSIVLRRITTGGQPAYSMQVLNLMGAAVDEYVDAAGGSSVPKLYEAVEAAAGRAGQVIDSLLREIDRD